MPAAHLIRSAAILAVAVSLAACGGGSAAKRDEFAVLRPPSKAATTAVPAPGAPPLISPDGAGESLAAPADAPPTAVPAPEAVAAIPPPPPPPAPPPTLTRWQLLDMGTDRVTQALGEPELVRREPPAEVWQYAVGACVIDIFMFDRGAGLKVAHVEGRDRRGHDGNVDQCLQSLQQRSGPPTS